MSSPAKAHLYAGEELDKPRHDEYAKHRTQENAPVVHDKASFERHRWQDATRRAEQALGILIGNNNSLLEGTKAKGTRLVKSI